MECTIKKELQHTSKELRHISYEERMSLNEQVNTLLDQITLLKDVLKEKTIRINKIVEKLEHLTWYSDLDQECLEMMYEIVLKSKDFHQTLIKYYIKFDDLRTKGIAKKEIKAFKIAIDDLKETNNDIETVYFKLPYNKEFREITKLLTSV